MDIFIGEPVSLVMSIDPWELILTGTPPLGIRNMHAQLNAISTFTTKYTANVSHSLVYLEGTLEDYETSMQSHFGYNRNT